MLRMIPFIPYTFPSLRRRVEEFPEGYWPKSKDSTRNLEGRQNRILSQSYKHKHPIPKTICFCGLVGGEVHVEYLCWCLEVGFSWIKSGSQDFRRNVGWVGESTSKMAQHLKKTWTEIFWFNQMTHPETNITLAMNLSQKETCLPSIHFQALC